MQFDKRIKAKICARPVRNRDPRLRKKAVVEKLDKRDEGLRVPTESL